METATGISMEEYLRTSFRPDCDFVDGEVRERNVGTFEHSRFQLLLGGWFLQHEEAWGVVALTEQRVRVSATRVRIPDVSLVPFGAAPKVIAEPLVLAVEVVSPDDTLRELRRRCQDYVAMGVRNIWIIDPEAQTGEMWVGDRWVEGRRLEAAGTPIFVELDALFRKLDASRAF